MLTGEASSLGLEVRGAERHSADTAGTVTVKKSQ